MDAYVRWLWRRVRRTGWLLQQRDTRTEMLCYLAAHSLGALLVHGRGYARTSGRRARSALGVMHG